MPDLQFTVDQRGHIEEFFDIIDTACHSLQEETGCPDEAIDQLLCQAIGSWQVPTLDQLEQALKVQQEQEACEENFNKKVFD